MGKRSNKSISPYHVIVSILIVALMLLVIVFSIYQITKEKPQMETINPNNSCEIQDNISSSNNDDDHALDIENSTIIEIDHTTRKEDCYTFLVAASDQSSGNADVIMVATYDTVKQTVGVISIPRDTLIDPSTIPARFPKINSAYHTGIDCLEEVVSNMLGIPIDYYFTIDVEGFIALVDAIGGIDFNVPVHMSYDDPHQGLSIHFDPGLQHLNGSEALKVCRLRYNQDGTVAYPDYDIGRTRTQQALLRAVAAKALSQPHKIKEYVDIFVEYCSTDLSVGNILWLAESALGIDIENDVLTATLPGNGEITYNGVSYCYQLYQEETLELVNQLINPYIEERLIDDLNII